MIKHTVKYNQAMKACEKEMPAAHDVSSEH